MYYDKRIRYLSYYESDIKLQNAGYVKFQVRDSLCQMVIYVKGPRLMGSGDAAVYLLSRKQEQVENDSFYVGSRDSRLQKHLLGNLNICGGQGHCAVRMDAENMADSSLRYDEICGIRIELHEYQYLESQWKVVNSMPQRQEIQRSESAGYRLRRPQGESRSAEQAGCGNGKYDRDVRTGNSKMEAAEDTPVGINLIVTPVSENLRVEKLVREEKPGEIAVEEVHREDIVTEVSTGNDPQTVRISDAEEEQSMQELLENEVRKGETRSGQSEYSPEKEAVGQEDRSAERRQFLQPEHLPEAEQFGPGGQPAETEQFPQSEQTLEEEVMQGMEAAKMTEEDGIRPEEQALRTDKWEQLKKTYPIVHPIREDEEYLKITPKDFVIFTEKYQGLVHNSFLLHGYYNYKHLILGKRQKDGKVIYYLGVPGTFHDREKTVAVMFGFEAFDGKREPAENGDFGYYLRRVEL